MRYLRSYISALSDHFAILGAFFLVISVIRGDSALAVYLVYLSSLGSFGGPIGMYLNTKKEAV